MLLGNENDNDDDVDGDGDQLFCGMADQQKACGLNLSLDLDQVAPKFQVSLPKTFIAVLVFLLMSQLMSCLMIMIFLRMLKSLSCLLKS